MHAVANRDFNDALQLAVERRASLRPCETLRPPAPHDVAFIAFASGFHGEPLSLENGGVLAVVDDVAVNGGEAVDERLVLYGGVGDRPEMQGDTGAWSASSVEDVIADLLSLTHCDSLPDPLDTESYSGDAFAAYEAELLWGHCLAALSLTPPTDHDLSDIKDLRDRKFDLSKPPRSYPEAMARPDRDVWIAAIKREKESLGKMGAFRVCDLPEGKKAIDVKWVFDFKYDEDGKRIHGMEKAQLVARGFTQRPDDYEETCAPVAKITSIRIILAWAAHRDAHIYQFDVSTAFLHARNRHPVYCCQIPCYPEGSPGQVLEVLVALYGLRQSAYEWYSLFMSILVSLGLIRCEADHGVFYAYWSSPPDPSIPLPLDGSPLYLVVPIHVDDGLSVTNSERLYKWFITRLQERIRIKDLGIYLTHTLARQLI
ncbi:hypothetical protein NLJ89_g11768 [Agrocybe chaxingu]|uniref:Reverse transcriptase Ty1/copia-type domain-containing protein n=1 Tax=Agrocybe chaxingu TaxID=84603 RepID=A0A9W8JW58_9AGAR|nr:hypothetical protein NLJ89_g11768 [Agrocybe chaxingu]